MSWKNLLIDITLFVAAIAICVASFALVHEHLIIRQAKEEIQALTKTNEKLAAAVLQHHETLELHKEAINDLKKRINGFVFIMEQAKPKETKDE